MNSVWPNLIACVLGVVGVIAELNLLRVFLGDWHRGAAEQRQRKPSKAKEWNMQSSTRQSGRSVPMLTALTLVAAATSWARGEGALSENARLSFQPEAPSTPAAPPESKPPTISTDRPGFGDSSGIAPVWRLQLEMGYTFTFRDREGVETRTHNGPEVVARAGLIEDRLELRLATAGYVWSRSDDGAGSSAVEGFSDLAVGFKLKILDQDGAIPRLALEGMTTVGTGSRDISNRDLEPTLKLIGSWDLGSGLSMTSNAVISYATASGERFVQGAGSVSLAYAATDRLSVFGEYFVVGPRTKGGDAAHSIDFGGAYLVNNRLQLDARVGFGLNREADNVFAGVGISVLF